MNISLNNPVRYRIWIAVSPSQGGSDMRLVKRNNSDRECVVNSPRRPLAGIERSRAEYLVDFGRDDDRLAHEAQQDFHAFALSPLARSLQREELPRDQLCHEQSRIISRIHELLAELVDEGFTRDFLAIDEATDELGTDVRSTDSSRRDHALGIVRTLRGPAPRLSPVEGSRHQVELRDRPSASLSSHAWIERLPSGTPSDRDPATARRLVPVIFQRPSPAFCSRPARPSIEVPNQKAFRPRGSGRDATNVASAPVGDVSDDGFPQGSPTKRLGVLDEEAQPR
ncbi:hypothetical protein [Curtobacterium sp. BH-2-1-1]|uniref:hypothetical protein n=1 Tax=Curtobacterium sp. BH-2-1-1 TaxID=1905847 RepID=UPI0012EA7F16|nr:hypothetical protein [Curtobacterium sp. BH-2-1-1]